jgi:hypothetical protein
MQWEHWVRSFNASDGDGIQEQLNGMSTDGWEVVSSWTAPGGPAGFAETLEGWAAYSKVKGSGQECPLYASRKLSAKSLRG